MSDKIREAFERWYMESRGLPYPCDGTELHRDEEGGYHFRDPADAWRAWQAALAQQPAPVAVPDGWKLVPVEPTGGMLDNATSCVVAVGDGADYVGRDEAAEIYRALLAAAPAAPVALGQGPVAWGLPNTTPGAPRPFLVLFHSTSQVNDPAGLVPLYTAPPAAEQMDAVKVQREAPTGIKVREILASISRQARNEACRHGMPRAGQACTFDGIADMADEALRALLAGGDKP